MLTSLTSFSVPLRSTVMIACLIGVPLAAVVGVRRSPADGSRIAATPPADSDQARMSAAKPGLAPAEEQVKLAHFMDRDPDRHTTQLTSLAVPVAEASSRGSHRPGPPVFWEDQPRANPQAGGEGHRPTQPVRPGNPKRGGQSAPHEALGTSRPKPGLQPAADPVAEDAPAEPMPAPPGGAASLPSPEQFRDLEQRLRKLGANQYRLETWGTNGELFRFRCMMDLDGRSGRSRYFEATDPDAMTAFRRVLGQVERWRGVQGPE